MVIPRIEPEAISKNYGMFVIGPLESGYGVTIGNALRRVLLSSLPGAAVTSLRVSGVAHEFSPIPGAKEDMTTLMLNVKQLRLRSYAEGPVRLTINAAGKSEITAADIDAPAEVEIINPELHLLTLDSSDSELEIELVVEKGRGYSPAEERGKLPIGQIPVDAIFSPIRKANFRVESTRVGQMTNYENVILEIWTDGAINPGEALSTAAQILIHHLSPIAGVSELPAELVTEVEGAAIPSHVYEMPIESLDLSMRAFNCLKRAGIVKVGEVLELLQKGDDELLSIRNFGQKSLQELKTKLQARGLWPIEPGPGTEAAGAETSGQGEEAE
ncbi:MAG: DNA-directed RNA polymerase subunit alpha [Chloroflexi bacterium]|nr:DNA-directed RNA polymerase subunit alpha [Chloroflexota bacterium]